MMKYYYLLLFATTLCACSDSEDPSYLLEKSVDAEVLPFLYAFEEEARLRGVEIDWAKHLISVQLVDIDTDAVGRCLTFSDDSRTVELDQAYWASQETMQQEFVIFHELGHCILDRVHLDEADRSGRCISMMHTSSESCRSNYNQNTRALYLDELFD